MTDLTPSAAELAAITLNGRRLTPEQSSWLVGSLQHERAYCSTPGELLELLSHPTPPPAPEVAQSAAAILGSAVEVANIREAAVLVQHIDEGYHYRRLSESAAVLESHAECIIAARNERDAATQRAEAAERELADANSRLESAALTLAEVTRERDEHNEAIALVREHLSEFTSEDVAVMAERAADELSGVRKERDEARDALTDEKEVTALATHLLVTPPTRCQERQPGTGEQCDKHVGHDDAHTAWPADGTRDGDGTWHGGKWLPTPPAAPSELAKELREFIDLVNWAAPNSQYGTDKLRALKLMDRAASALSAPGSEAPEIVQASPATNGVSHD